MKTKSAMKSSGVTTSYSGPVRLPTQDGLDARTLRANISLSQEFISNGGGVISGYVTGGDVGATTDWARFEELYQEFRILGVELEYTPYFNGAYNTARTPSSGHISVAHAPLTAAPTSSDQVIQYDTWQPWRSSQALRKHWRMRGIEEASFSPVAAPSAANAGGILWYIAGLSASQAYGRVTYTWLVEFRGRK